MDNQNKPLDDLKKLRDEIRVKMHLGGMEVKEWWSQMEPKLTELEDTLERGVDSAADSAALVIDELSEAFRRVRDRMDGDQ